MVWVAAQRPAAVAARALRIIGGAVDAGEAPWMRGTPRACVHCTGAALGAGCCAVDDRKEGRKYDFSIRKEGRQSGTLDAIACVASARLHGNTTTAVRSGPPDVP